LIPISELQWASWSISLAGQEGFSQLPAEQGSDSLRREKLLNQFWLWLLASVNVIKPLFRKRVTPFKSQQ
jgi:hypothetical protein